MSGNIELRDNLFNAKKIPNSVFLHILHKGWLRIWIPEKYQGLNYSLNDGLQLLYDLAKIDGSLGWTVTLCSGANYFSRNISPEFATKTFSDPNVCLGGSGMITGTAEKQGDQYLINGKWSYATGAPHLTHFTINAQITKNKELCYEPNGDPEFLSFCLSKDYVNIIPNWNTIGLVATSSHDFTINNVLVPCEQSFKYDQFYGEEVLNKIPFQTFADLTLIVNYLGMAKHFVESSRDIKQLAQLNTLEKYIDDKITAILNYGEEVTKILTMSTYLPNKLISDIHSSGQQIVKNLIQEINSIYPALGIKAANLDEETNQVYRDFFTATQHKNFRD